MTDRSDEGTPVPRDPPDQQAGAGDDPWDVDASDPTAPDTPDTDEAGTGRRGAPHASGVRPEQPVPNEPSG
ncbi:hypothetical protein [Streptomyces antibioticus]|uniref:hypothetical protein n=1 Tax=Streptomyces antibioticus TaxID=1890 RepID=UPI0033EDB74C